MFYECVTLQIITNNNSNLNPKPHSIRKETMKYILHLIKVFIDTLKDPQLLSSRPHHGEEHDDTQDIMNDYHITQKQQQECDYDNPHHIDYCFITDKPITEDSVWFSHEFDCYISEEGYKKIMNHKCTHGQCEWCIIKKEFTKKLIKDCKSFSEFFTRRWPK